MMVHRVVIHLVGWLVLRSGDGDQVILFCIRQVLQVGGIAQLGEHLLCKQGVIGSIPIVSTTRVCKQTRRNQHVLSRRQSFARVSLACGQRIETLVACKR